MFRQNSIKSTHLKANWLLIKKHKQDLINKGNKQTNKERKEHTCNIVDNVLLENAWKTKLNQNINLSSYIITVVKNNNTDRPSKVKVTKTFNICNTCNITLYKK